MDELASIFAQSLPTRMIWSTIRASKSPKDELTKWDKVIRDLTVIQSLRPASTSERKHNTNCESGADGSLHDIVVEDENDWMDSDWTEINHKDLNSKFTESNISFSEIKEKLTPLLSKKFEIKKEEIDLTISHYFNDFR